MRHVATTTNTTAVQPVQITTSSIVVQPAFLYVCAPWLLLAVSDIAARCANTNWPHRHKRL